MEQLDPAISLTVRRGMAGASTLLFGYTGDPQDAELQGLIEHLTGLLAIDRLGTHLEVVLAGRPDQPKFVRMAAALRMLQKVAGSRVICSIQ